MTIKTAYYLTAAFLNNSVPWSFNHGYIISFCDKSINTSIHIALHASQFLRRNGGLSPDKNANDIRSVFSLVKAKQNLFRLKINFNNSRRTRKVREREREREREHSLQVMRLLNNRWC